VSCISGIGSIDKPLVKFLLAHTSLVSGDEKNGPLLRIKSKGYPPLSILRLKSEFLHICVGGSVQFIHVRSSRLWAKDLYKTCFCIEFFLNFDRQFFEFQFKLIME